MTVPFSVGKIHKTKPHLFADAVELVLFFDESSFDQASSHDILSLINNDLSIQGDEANTFSDTTKPDREQGYVEGCMSVLKHRSIVYGDMYPFTFSSDLLTPRQDLTDIHFLYLFLLVSSRTYAFPSMSNQIAAEFEIVSKEAMRAIMPGGSDVYVFGAGSSDRREHFHSDLRKALPILADKANFKLMPDWKKGLSASGDGKIDVIGIKSFRDKMAPSLVMIGQCAARADNWEQKRHEAVLSRIQGHRLSSHVEPTPIFFIPVCFRQSNNSWVNEGDILSVLTIDRQRYFELLSAHEIPGLCAERISQIKSQT